MVVVVRVHRGWSVESRVGGERGGWRGQWAGHRSPELAAAARSARGLGWRVQGWREEVTDHVFKLAAWPNGVFLTC